MSKYQGGWLARFALMLVASSCFAQGPFTGTWQAEVEVPSGNTRKTTFFLQQNGNSLTGAVLIVFRMLNISDGKVADGKATWVVVQPSGNRQEYEAQLTENGLTVHLPPQSNAIRRDVIAKKLSADGTPVHPFAKLPKVQLPALHPIPDNGLARTPPMGWNSWNHFSRRVDDKTVREIADAIVSSGMKNAGYTYVNIDDTWEGERDSAGVLHSNSKFPDMKALADYVHSKGLKLGLYSSPGPVTCANYAGSYGHEEQDAKTWAAWGIDYLKYDWCSASQMFADTDMPAVYQRMGEALRAAARPIVYSLCQYGQQHVETWGTQVGGNLWRTTGDINDSWKSMSSIGFEKEEGLAKYATVGHWNDPDMLEIGNGGMSSDEYRTHMSLWALLAAPLIAGNDLRSMSDATRDILTNEEVIAIDQDPAGHQGYRVSKDGDSEVWAKPLSGGRLAVGLFNRGTTTATVTARWSDLKLAGEQKVRDLWTRKDHGAVNDHFAAEVPSHGVVLIRVAP